MVTEAYSLIRQSVTKIVQCLNRRHRALLPNNGFDYLLSSPCKMIFIRFLHY